tara:strand:+ start:93 stop:320 length:228 start_codon:yes stop_codon:yes gene_type:complete
LSLINKQQNFELLEDDSSDFSTGYSEIDAADLSRTIKKNRRILDKYRSLIRSAVTLDALLDSENDENHKNHKINY